MILFSISDLGFRILFSGIATSEPALSEILRYAQNDKGKLGVRMTESEGARNDRVKQRVVNNYSLLTKLES